MLAYCADDSPKNGKKGNKMQPLRDIFYTFYADNLLSRTGSIDNNNVKIVKPEQLIDRLKIFCDEVVNNSEKHGYLDKKTYDIEVYYTFRFEDSSKVFRSASFILSNTNHKLIYPENIREVLGISKSYIEISPTVSESDSNKPVFIKEYSNNVFWRPLEKSELVVDAQDFGIIRQAEGQEYKTLFDLFKTGANMTTFNVIPRRRSMRMVQHILNIPRPYRSSDSYRRHFIENIAVNPEQAAMYRARSEFFIKAY